MMAWYRARCGCKLDLVWRGRVPFKELPEDRQNELAAQAVADHEPHCPKRTPPKEPTP